MSLEIVILAAGQGTRMRSALPKVLHPIAGKPMLGHVIDCARQLQPERIHVVIGHGADLVRERMAADDLNFVLQAEQLGTGHAVAQALPFLSADQVLILYGDVPLIQLDTLQRLLAQVTPDQLSLLTVDMLDTYAANLRKLKRVFIDCGSRDQYALHHGARIFVAKARKRRIPLIHEEFDDNHSSISYRYDRSLAVLSRALG